MYLPTCIFLFTISLGQYVLSQTEEGDTCIDQNTYTIGQCTSAKRCESARLEFEKNNIRPTNCGYGRDGPIVCCKDSSNILQTPSPSTNDRASDTRPIWGTFQDEKKRVSDRKCEEYSRGVTETVDFLSLVPDPDRLSISAAKCDYAGVELIVGGENALLGEFPHMAAIGWVDFGQNYTFKCGGSLISPRFILTAGHCISDPNSPDPRPAIVRLGDQNLDPSVKDGARPIEVPIKNIHKHPDFAPPMRYHDIALLELATDVDFETRIRPACLWSKPSFEGNAKALATGWGATDPRSQVTSKELQKVSLSLLDNDHCDKLLMPFRFRHWQGFIPSQMCAGELRGGKDTCQGDSGSPLQVASKDNQCIFHILGITSFGRKCAETGRPAIYTRVSSYVDWIESVVWPGE